MDPNDGKDGVAAPNVLCGRSVVSLGDTNIRACSYQREKYFNLGRARSCGDTQLEKELHKSCLDLMGISSPGDDDKMVVVPVAVDTVAKDCTAGYFISIAVGVAAGTIPARGAVGVPLSRESREPCRWVFLALRAYPRSWGARDPYR